MAAFSPAHYHLVAALLVSWRILLRAAVRGIHKKSPLVF
ncbi:hypothetical protein QY96_02112 [Bacillus thermotolerans]|uniref:Uncharacterized protein n=1 Tax=Bacillus thermotolerans TaxID=1221996 RepID=A0A0F5HM68_BACTR|nr:hypothetical protein QY95_03974 [Bacillus thermotolerans]KKB41092.1 hypothetical protein QY96_02112 [Bacillus thermotolerans]